MSTTKRLVPGKYDPIKIVIPAGLQQSEPIFLGRASIMGFYVEEYNDPISFMGAMVKEGSATASEPYATLQKPESTDAYSITPNGNYSCIPVDYTVFATPNWIIISLSATPATDVLIHVQPYDI